MPLSEAMGGFLKMFSAVGTDFVMGFRIGIHPIREAVASLMIHRGFKSNLDSTSGIREILSASGTVPVLVVTIRSTCMGNMP